MLVIVHLHLSNLKMEGILKFPSSSKIKLKEKEIEYSFNDLLIFKFLKPDLPFGGEGLVRASSLLAREEPHNAERFCGDCKGIPRSPRNEFRG